MKLAVTLADIWQARQTIRGAVVRTPLLQVPEIDRIVGASVRIKAEALQRTGSFKVRGAFNKVASLTPEEKRRGIITASAGNAALGAAYAAVQNGTECVVVMPATAVRFKVDAVRAYGATVILEEGDSNALFARVEQLRQEKGYTFVHPFDDPKVVAGQGTVGWEIAEDAPDLDYLLVPASGGGLLGGVLTAIKGLTPSVKVIGVQPESCPGLILSLEAGSVQQAPVPQTIADGLTARKPGHLNFAIVRELVDEMTTVSDAEIRRAMGVLYRNAKLLVEGAGAAAMAYAMRDQRFRGKRIGVIASGGNVSPALAAEILQGGE
ncbi:MAG: threonine ammonia-lyase [Bacillota bacterium]